MPHDKMARTSPTSSSNPPKVMRIGSMIKQLLDEVKSAPLDKRPASVSSRSTPPRSKELEDGLAPNSSRNWTG